MKNITYNENTHKLVPREPDDDMCFATTHINNSLDREDVLAMLRAAIAAAPSPVVEQRPELTVWEGPMPESNGKSNFTAVLHRKDAKGFKVFTEGFSFARSEYPDRVRYDADCMRFLIGEIAEESDILAYDHEKHSGYTQPSDGVTSLAAIHNSIEGWEVSVDVSTGEHDGGNRIFGRVIGVQHGAGGATILVEETSRNFAAAPAHAGSFDNDEFKMLLVSYRNELEDVTKSRAALIAHITSLVTSARQEGREKALEEAAVDPIRQLIARHAEFLEESDYTYFELARTRTTGWMAWICSHPSDTHPDRKVLARGQGDTPDEACADALASAQPGEQGEG